MYGLVLAASTMVPLQGFWNFVVYAKPRYFNHKGIALFRSAMKRLSKRLSTKSTEDEEGHNDTPEQGNIPDATSPINKSDDNKKLSLTDDNATAHVSEIVPFGAPDSPKDDDCKSDNSNQDNEHQVSSNDLFVELSGVDTNTNNALDESADPEMSSSNASNERNPANRHTTFARSSFFMGVARRFTNVRNTIHVTQINTDITPTIAAPNDSHESVTDQHLNEDDIIARLEMLLAG